MAAACRCAGCALRERRPAGRSSAGDTAAPLWTLPPAAAALLLPLIVVRAGAAGGSSVVQAV